MPRPPLNWKQLLQIIAVSVCLKVLLVPAYRSTDFEVHRNWMAITSSLPLHRWYFDETSQWTLDYPPLFAYFERLLAVPAAYFDPKMLELSSLGYASEATVLFQRLTVIAAELVLLVATYFWGKAFPDGSRILTLVAFNAGLLIVDHMHFQYNGLLLGILVLCVHAAREERTLLLAVLFTVLVLLKHLFVPLAPLVAIILLKQCVSEGDLRKLDVLKASVIVLAVVAVVVAAFWPIFMDSPDKWEQLQQILRRLFPFGRGLVHAYWAPNVWALYYFIDKVLSFVCRKMLGVSFGAEGALTNSASGIVGDFALNVLPRVPPAVCVLLLLVFTFPAGFAIWRKNDAKTLVNSFAFVMLSSFMIGFHVHEKAILVPLVLYSLRSMPSASDIVFFMVLSGVSVVSLFPLIFGKIEWFIKVLAAVAYLTVCWKSLRCNKLPSLEQGVIAGVYTVLFLCVFYADVLHPFFFTAADGTVSMPFLPLMQMSVICTLLLLRPWGYSCLQLLIS